MSADLRDFAAAFNQSFQHASTTAVNAADKAQQRAIQIERNKIIDKHNAANARRDDIKLGLYAESVKNAGALAQARAAKLLGGKGGGGGGAPASSGTPDEVDKRLGNVGLTLDKPAPAPQINVNVRGNGDGDGGGPDPGAIEPPAGSTVLTERRGGMVRKMASGGIVGDLSLGQAESYETREKADSSTPKSATDAFSSGLSSGATAAAKAEKDKETTKPTTPQPATKPPTALIPNVAPDLTGTGETYRRGGAVRRYADGGAVATAIPNLETEGPQAIQYAPPTQPVAAPQYSAPGGSANAATGSGGDSAGGASGTGGVGGSASDSAGGSAAAGTSGDAGSDGGGTYRRGGRVRRFQSGGRVMEAIDTGMSGPGSGFGHRAAPPSVRR